MSDRRNAAAERPVRPGSEPAKPRRRADGRSIREEKRRRWQAKHPAPLQLPPTAQRALNQKCEGRKERLTADASVLGSGILAPSSHGAAVDRAGGVGGNSGSGNASLKRPRPEGAAEAWASTRERAHLVTPDDVRALRRGVEGGGGGGGTSPANDRLSAMLAPYANLRDSSLVARQGLFVAEGTETVRLLLGLCEGEDDARIEIQSIVCKPSVLLDPPVSLAKSVESAWRADQLVLDHPGRDRGETFSVLIADESVQNELAGYAGSRGAMACGRVPARRDESWLFQSYLPRRSTRNSGRVRLLALDGVSDAANLGSAVRTASAFGLDAVVLSRNSCDAWYRRSIRVSMGHVFRVPTVRVDDLAATLRTMLETFQVTSYAAVVGECDLILERMEHGSVAHSWCCVLGNESSGVSDPVSRACSRRVRIDMDDGVDSLSIPVATGILLHGLKERERAPSTRE